VPRQPAVQQLPDLGPLRRLNQDANEDGPSLRSLRLGCCSTNALDKPGTGCYPNRPMPPRFLLLVAVAELLGSRAFAAPVVLEPVTSKPGYVARLLINEVPFPGDPLYRSEADSMRCMLEILWVLDNRIRHIPPGYTQERVANTQTDDIIGVITAPGQVQDFYRESDGRFTAARRVITRVDYLVNIANEGTPGRFARLLNHAQTLARDYFEGRPRGEDMFAVLRRVGPYSVTGRAYAWMTSDLPFRPGGDFVSIPRSDGGAPGGNHFYTLRQESR
jgi:hypothetical protein